MNLQHTKRRSIALLSPVGIGIHGQVLSGLLGAPELHDGSIRTNHFFSHSIQEEEIAKQIDMIMEEKHDLLITIGLSCTKAVRAVLAKRKTVIPHIFVGISEPARWGIVENDADYAKNYMTGIQYLPYESTAATEFLVDAKPKMKSILVALEGMSMKGSHLDEAWPDVEIQAIRNVCEPKGIEVRVHQSHSLSCVYRGIVGELKRFDTIFMLEGAISMEMHAAIGELCSAENKTMFSGFLDAVRTSAAIGYGASYEVLGAKAAEYAHKILLEDQSIATLPPLIVEQGRRPAVNLGRAKEQDLDAEFVEHVCKARGGIIF